MAKPLTRKQKAIGRELRRLREEAGWTIDQVAERAPFSTATVSRAEDGRVGGDNTRTLCELYGADAATTERLSRLARVARWPSWWLRYKVDDSLTEYLEVESDAVELRSWTGPLVLGLLQTEGYARAMVRARHPRATDEWINDRVALRLQRQERRMQDLVVWVVMHEVVLKVPVGGREVMAEQLDRLVKLAGQPNVTMQVLPLDLADNPAMGDQFNLFDLGSVGPPTAHVEYHTGSLFVEEYSEVREYEQTFQHLTASALDPGSSVRKIASAAEEMAR